MSVGWSGNFEFFCTAFFQDRTSLLGDLRVLSLPVSDPDSGFFKNEEAEAVMMDDGTRLQVEHCQEGKSA